MPVSDIKPPSPFGVWKSNSQRAQEGNVKSQQELYTLLDQIAKYKDFQSAAPGRMSRMNKDMLADKEFTSTSKSRIESTRAGQERTSSEWKDTQSYKELEGVNGPDTYSTWYSNNSTFAQKNGLTEKYQPKEFKRMKKMIINTPEHMREMELERTGPPSGSGGSVNDKIASAIQKYSDLLDYARQNKMTPQATDQLLRTVMNRIELQLVVKGSASTTPRQEAQAAQKANLPRGLGALGAPNYQTPGMLPGTGGGTYATPGTGTSEASRGMYQGKPGYKFNGMFYSDAWVRDNSGNLPWNQ